MREVAIITRWIVAFLVIFLLCMLLVFYFVRKQKREQEAIRRRQVPMYFLY
jgi:preprotein translocase subunit YajC